MVQTSLRGVELASEPGSVKPE